MLIGKMSQQAEIQVVRHVDTQTYRQRDSPIFLS